MRSAGFDVTSVAQSRTRDVDRQEHTKHLIRFRPQGSVPSAEGLHPEIVLINSHDGTSSYQLFAGVYRLVCANGLMFGETFDAVRIRHTGNPIREVIDASYTVIDSANRALAGAASMNALPLSCDEQQAFAESAHQLRFDGTPVAEATGRRDRGTTTIPAGAGKRWTPVCRRALRVRSTHSASLITASSTAWADQEV